MKKKYILISLFLMLNSLIYADMNIIKNGKVVVHKVYSEDVKTVVVHKSKKIYVCSIDGNNSKCILSELTRNRQSEEQELLIISVKSPFPL